jgi:hypothetical protein
MAALEIAYPDVDLLGEPRPRHMPPLALGSEAFRRIVKTLQRRRAREPDRAAALDAMQLDLWRKAHRALGWRALEAPSRAGWRELIAAVPRVARPPADPTISRAVRRRRALALQGLAKSWRTKRPLVAANQAPVQFGRRRWESPVPRTAPRQWRFSPYRLDYYASQQVPVDPRDWIPAPLLQRLVQRGRTRRSPQAASRRRPG